MTCYKCNNGGNEGGYSTQSVDLDVGGIMNFHFIHSSKTKQAQISQVSYPVDFHLCGNCWSRVLLSAGEAISDGRLRPTILLGSVTKVIREKRDV